MKILALDLGTLCGYASNYGHAIASGVLDLKPKRFEGGGMRFLRFKSSLEGFAELNKFDLLVFEEVRRHMSTDAAHVYGGLMAVVTSFCEEKEIPYKGVPVQHIKKHITGKGNANKLAVIQAVRDLGHNPKDDNEADAIALLLLEMHNIQRNIA